MYAGSRMYEGLERLKAAGFAPKAILDGGAYDGDWARGARALFPEAYILMIDALAEREPNIGRACAEIGNADYRIAMLGDAAGGEGEFFVVNSTFGQTGSSRYSENTGQPKVGRTLPQVTVETLIAGRASGFDFVKLDVQGSELDVLRGWGPSLGQVEAVLMEISVAPYNAGAPLAQEVFSEMKALGFTFYDVLDEMRHGGERRYLMQFDGLFLREGSDLLPKPPF